MFRAIAAEVQCLLINSQDFRGLGSGMFVSQAPPHLFHQDFCALLEWKLSWGTKVMLRAFPESAGNNLNSSLQQNTEAIPKLILCLQNVLFLLKAKKFCSIVFCQFAKLDLNIR
jgi:hypothetical protein